MFTLSVPFPSLRARFARLRGWLPFALALAMLAALIALGGDRGYFYRDAGLHNREVTRNISIAENLSAEHGFRLATRIWMREDGGFDYDVYSRFPVGGHVLLKLAILPFGDDIAAKLLAARVFAMLMFCGAALCACLSIARITGSASVAIAAVLLGFSGLYSVYYADGIINEGFIAICGAALAFHGMTVFVQEGRFLQLAVKICAALLLGWRVYALLLPFIALGMGGEAVAYLRSASPSGERSFLPRARGAALALVRSRYAALAAIAILFGSALLTFNLVNEYAAYEGDRALSETPSFRSMARRLGWSGMRFEPLDFLKPQLFRLGVQSSPYSLARAVGYDFPMWERGGGIGPDTPLAPALLGAAVACAGLAAAIFVRRRRILIATAVLFGFCWAALMRYQVRDHDHSFESLPYIGVGLTLFALALVCARRLFGARAALGMGAACAAATAVFATSVFYAGQLDRNPREAERDYAEMADATAIREIASGKRVRVIRKTDVWSRRQMHPRVWSFYLSGSYIKTMHTNCRSEDDADFVVAPWRHDSLESLTPDNRFWFLYRDATPLELCRAERDRLESREPTARSAFDIYIEGDRITYLKSRCAPEDYDTPFYGYVHPVDSDDIPKRYKRDAVHRTFHSEITLAGMDLGAVFDGACIMTLQLPTYPIAAVETGQRISYGETLWKAFAPAPLGDEARALYEDAYRETAKSGDPAIRAEFDLYLDGGALIYLKQPCSEDDARGRFFLSVHPADVDDLPAERREIGHDSLNFTFAPPFGAFFNGKCMATRQLPDYEIARIETGQWIPGGERLWDAEIAVGE